MPVLSGHGRADGVDDARPGIRCVPFVALRSNTSGSQRPTDIMMTLLGVEVLLLGALGVAALQGPIGAGSSFSIRAPRGCADSSCRRAHTLVWYQVEQVASRATGRRMLIESRSRSRELHDIIPTVQRHAIRAVTGRSRVLVLPSPNSFPVSLVKRCTLRRATAPLRWMGDDV